MSRITVKPLRNLGESRFNLGESRFNFRENLDLKDLDVEEQSRIRII